MKYQRDYSNYFINFETLTQAVLWENEISGQISDGAWENSRPFDHWIDWCNATVKIDPANPGITFYPMRNGYNLLALIQYVGDRMRVYGCLAKLYPEAVRKCLEADVRLPDDEDDYDRIVKWSEDPNQQWASARVNGWVKAGLARWMVTNAQNTNYYDMKELRADLKRMKQIMKTHAK